MIARPTRTIPVPDAEVPEPLTKPQAHDWDDDPRTCARYDDRHWDDLYDRDEE